MPTYEFRCPNGHVFDRFFGKISDAPSDVACPDCGEMAHRQISGGAGLLFKGSGFYLTDYGKNAHRGSAPPSKGGESSGGESKSSGGSSGGGESKSAGDSGSKSSDAGSSSAAPKSESKTDKSSSKGPSDGGGKKSSGGSTT